VCFFAFEFLPPASWPKRLSISGLYNKLMFLLLRAVKFQFGLEFLVCQIQIGACSASYPLIGFGGNVEDEASLYANSRN